jgi:hypothetical protein
LPEELEDSGTGAAGALARLGIVCPVALIDASRAAGVPLPLAASLLVQESGGGRNEWGHDPTIFVGGYDAKNDRRWGETVTKAADLEYKRQRGPTGNGGMQGVGPCQLTYYALQDEADGLGGCWLPKANLTVGMRLLAANIRREGERAGVALYNGSGPAAARYADAVLARAARFASALGVRQLESE